MSKFLRALSLCMVGACIVLIQACSSDMSVVDSNSTATNDKSRDQVVTNNDGPSVNGQAALLRDYMNGEVQHMAFHASKDADGNVTGTFESKSPGQDTRVHGDITCLNILGDGKTAQMAGLVTQVVGEGFPVAVGDYIVFVVQDNGEGSNGTADMFSDWTVAGTTAPDCSWYNGGLSEIENGNIQVKP